MKITRLIDKKIKDFLKISGAVQIVGPKWCGKTYISEKNCNSAYYMQEIGLKNREIVDSYETINNPILVGKRPRLIDEWQIVPEIRDKIRFYIDKKNENGIFIITGSTTPFDTNSIIHSGAGRFTKIEMQTLTFNEIYPEFGMYSIMDFFDGKIKLVPNDFNFDMFNVSERLILGGWPKLVNENSKNNTGILSSYIDWICGLENNYVNDISINNKVFLNVMKSIARLSGSILNISTVASDVGIDRRTATKYIEILENLFIIQYLDIWSPRARSKIKIRTKPKMYLCDPSIGLYLLDIHSTDKLIANINTFGIYFENQVIKDLKVYASVIGANIYYYRNERGEEVDCIFELNDGRWGLIEIKLGSFDFDKTIDLLNSFDKKIDFENETILNNKPSFKLIITAGKYSYYKDDVYVIPHFLLKI